MEQTVRVKETYDDGTALVIHLRQSACSGDCHKCSGCGAAVETILLKADNPIGAAVGDFVTIRSESAPVLKAAAVMYMVPVVLFFAGYLLGAMVWNHGAMAGCLAFAAGICLAVVYDRKVVRKEKAGYTITGFTGESLLKLKKKGDNELD
ncbi:MAG: SoxR reducing system RseC family protein [Oscillospiraceae bacterium]|nr:SoxR reducing system RseC family protein [Oscillospiraceae bacterium]